MTDESTDRSETAKRAQPLALQDRQAMIIDAVIPLLIEHGRQLTSKQIAEAAGIAEGTIFRAFGDKENLIKAAVERYLDPEPLRQELRALDPALPLEVKVRTVVVLLRERFGNVFQVMAAVGMTERPGAAAGQQLFSGIVADLLEPDLARLSMTPARIASFVRLIAFASAFPRLNESVGFSDDELASAILYGVAGVPRDTAPEDAVASTGEDPVRTVPGRTDGSPGRTAEKTASPDRVLAEGGR